MQTVFGDLCSHWKSKPLQLLEKGSFWRIQVAFSIKGSGKAHEPPQKKLATSLATGVRILNVTVPASITTTKKKRGDETQPNHKQGCRQHSCDNLERCKLQCVTTIPIYFRLKVRIKDVYFREERICSFKCLPLLNAARHTNLVWPFLYFSRQISKMVRKLYAF